MHYVAPMVWAWRPGRVRNAVRAADHLMTLLPFEPDYFIPRGLPATFVGHPVLERAPAPGAAEAFRARWNLAPEAPLIAVLPGSRGGEVRRLLPIFRAAVALMAAKIAGLVTVIPTVETVADQVATATADWPTPVIVAPSQDEKWGLLRPHGWPWRLRALSRSSLPSPMCRW